MNGIGHRLHGAISGFTIVELLVVVVVIGILASVTVTAFGGVMERSEDAKIKTAVSQYIKILESYAVTNGGKMPQADWACLGELYDYPAENGYAAGWCHKPDEPEPIPTGNDHPINPVLNDRLRTLSGRLPSGRTPEIQRNATTFYRGMLYDSAVGFNGGLPVIDFYIQGVRPCPIGEVFSQSATYSFTRCVHRFTTPSETGN